MSKLSSRVSTSFLDRFLWKPELGTEPTSSDWSFDGDMLDDIQSGISYAFLCANDTNTVIEKTVTLLSPYHGGNTVIDAVLRNTAQKENADVLVLDSLVLAAGRFGALGKDGAFVDAIYSRLPIERFTDVEDIQQFFPDLLLAGFETTPSDSLPRRVIYVRDFGTIACAAIPLMIFIFRAIKNLRNARKANLIVLFGSSRPLGREACPHYYDSARGFYTFNWTFEESGICSDD
ncbi:hypothetical protein E1B28_006180 [Marasmius oreades]|uniref:Uncharacterized protein n=1 Tax=Marasmius oreades TaxID=181124 RepID=A0A9P7UW22_9AGAR|nr:uncharacterized protein E1B28_006180 [Marasmius oreades]KAG7095431.1 hypothetical protein E1B28_006180 [Marasmius oreades]